MNRKGHLFVVSAPSGAGKTTLCSAILKALPDLEYSISHTTRSPRKGEREGINYYFIWQLFIVCLMVMISMIYPLRKIFGMKVVNSLRA